MRKTERPAMQAVLRHFPAGDGFQFLQVHDPLAEPLNPSANTSRSEPFSPRLIRTPPASPPAALAQQAGDRCDTSSARLRITVPGFTAFAVPHFLQAGHRRTSRASPVL